MDLKELQSDWENIQGPKKTQTELSSMIELKDHPELKTLRFKFVMEVVLLVAYLLVYNDFFDGANKPFWVNGALIISASLFIASDVVGWLILRNPIKEGNIMHSLDNFRARLTAMSWFSICASFLFGCSFILFSSISIDLTQNKYLFLIGMVAGLCLLVYLSGRSWLRRTSNINQAIAEFENSVH